MKRILRIVTWVMIISGGLRSGHSFAHTVEETNSVVRTMLIRLAWDASHDHFKGGRLKSPPVNYDSWDKLLNGIGNGWTFDEKKSAFDWYLSTLGTNVWHTGDILDSDDVEIEVDDEDTIYEESYVRLALAFCRDVNHTNALPHLKALALNPHGVYREDANELAIKFGPIDDAMTDFVELIGTNVVMYNYMERGTYCTYQERLAAIPATNAAAVAVRERAVRRFYQHRFNPSAAGSVSRDELFRDYLAGYAQSSNRLEFACHILGIEEGRINDGEYFITLTNQLLSSGQPLRQLNIGGNNQ